LKQLTVRGLDEDLDQALKREAEEQGLSVNRFVVRVLREAVGLYLNPVDTREFHDLDHLAGTWSETDAEELDNALDEQRQIDKSLWQ
jgi:hypothetical protein